MNGRKSADMLTLCLAFALTIPAQAQTPDLVLIPLRQMEQSRAVPAASTMVVASTASTTHARNTAANNAPLLTGDLLTRRCRVATPLYVRLGVSPLLARVRRNQYTERVCRHPRR